MAMPTISSVEECADFSTTVEPFLPQLYELPLRVWTGITGQGHLLDIYTETNPLISGLAFSIFTGLVLLVVSEINRNYSQVDRLWSILPTIYTLHLTIWARMTGLSHERLDLVVLASFAWSYRLTFNYWRKGGYQKGSEDYRWAIIKENIPSWMFFLLNVTFISTMQSVLLFAISLPPAYVVLLANQVETGIRPSDLCYFVVIICLVISEWVSDGQQWDYQSAKHQYRKDAKVPKGCQYSQADLDRGFVTSGLWAYSRHPNFAAEQLIWFVLYQWGCFASNTLYGWSCAGAVSLIMLFQSSTWLTELITASKYPDYAHYQKRVSRFFPIWFSPYESSQGKSRVIRTSELAQKKNERKKQK